MTTDLKKLAEVTQTPRTDALVQITEGGAQIFDRLWMLNHARTLELECTALKQEVETLRAEMHGMQDGALVRDLKAQLARTRQETLEEAREEMRKLTYSFESRSKMETYFERALQHTGEDGRVPREKRIEEAYVAANNYINALLNASVSPESRKKIADDYWNKVGSV